MTNGGTRAAAPSRRGRWMLALMAVAASLPGRARSADLDLHPLGTPPRSEPAVVRAPIYNGQPTGSYSAVVAVVIVNGDGSSGLCSGTLISPNVVLTAAHCLSLGPTAAQVLMFTDAGTQLEYPAAEYAVHPEFDLGRLAVADVSVLVLATAAGEVAPQPLAARRPRPGTHATIVGFGDDSLGGVGVKREGAVRLTRCPRAVRKVGIGPGQLAGSLCWRPKRHGQDTCQGDSGGPLLVKGAVAGVTSGGYPTCPGRLSWDTDVVGVRDWIEAAVAHAAASP